MIRIRPIRHRQPQRPRHSILLRLFNLLHLFAFPLLLLLGPLFGRELGVFGFGVPVEAFVLLPAADGRHDGVAEVVFAVGGGFDIVPAEVDAAAGAFFAHGLEEVHDGGVLFLFPLSLGRGCEGEKSGGLEDGGSHMQVDRI